MALRGAFWRGTKGVPRKGVWTPVTMRVFKCKELRVNNDRTSCYLRPPFLGTPIVPSRALLPRLSAVFRRGARWRTASASFLSCSCHSFVLCLVSVFFLFVYLFVVSFVLCFVLWRPRQASRCAAAAPRRRSPRWRARGGAGAGRSPGPTQLDPIPQ